VKRAGGLQVLDDMQLAQLATCLSKGDAKRFKREVKSGIGLIEAPDSPNASSDVVGEASGSGGGGGTKASEHHPFEVDPLDHCETDVRAYQDIAVLLNEVAGKMNRTAGTLQIYDPYYCDGGVKRRMREAGFPCVYNKNEV